MATSAAVAVGLIPATLGGTVDLTVSGFGTPTAAIIFASNANSTNNPQDNSAISVGFWTNAAQYCASVGSESGTSGSSAYRSSGTLAKALQAINALTDAILVDATAALAPGGDGVRITVTTDNTGAQRYVAAILIKGTTNVSALNYTLGTGTSYDITSIGFKPDLVFLTTTGNTATTTATNSILSFGAAHNNSSDTVTQGMVAMFSEDGQSTTETGSYASSTYSVGQYFNGSLSWGASAGSFDANGFTLTASANPGSDYINVLALELADPDDAWVGFIDAATSTGNSDSTAPGFQPDVVGFAASIATAFNTHTDGASMALGAADGTSQRCVDFTDEDAQSTTDTDSYADLSNVLRIRNHDGTTDAIASLSSLDSSGFTLNYSDAAASAKKILAFAIGDSTAAASTVTLSNLTFASRTATSITPRLDVTVS